MNHSPSKAVNNAIIAFDEAKVAHAGSMLRLNDISEAISRCTKERDQAQEQSKEAETNWRTRFRNLRGEMTEDLRNEHSQRISQMELAKEFADLIDDLALDQKTEILCCAGTAKKLLNAHKHAFVTYAEYQWSQALKNLSPSLVRVIKLKLHALSMVSAQEVQSGYYREPAKVVSELIGNKLIDVAKECDFDMEIEPVLEKIGLYHPSLAGVDMVLMNSPIKQQQLYQELNEVKKQRQQAK
ncbi:MAG: hypothetical protein ACOH2G_17875 [Ewingella sp.]